jgi:hypothetical protein
MIAPFSPVVKICILKSLTSHKHTSRIPPLRRNAPRASPDQVRDLDAWTFTRRRKEAGKKRKGP